MSNETEPTMPFGKHKGKPFGEVPPEYLVWLAKQEGFADDERNDALKAYIKANWKDLKEAAAIADAEWQRKKHDRNDRRR